MRQTELKPLSEDQYLDLEARSKVGVDGSRNPRIVGELRG
jgi:hypothetical protein